MVTHAADVARRTRRSITLNDGYLIADERAGPVLPSTIGAPIGRVA